MLRRKHKTHAAPGRVQASRKTRKNSELQTSARGARAQYRMLLVLKLFFLGVRQISKPIANRAKDAAHSSGLMKAVAVGLGRGMYRLQTQVTRLSEGKPPLLRVAQLEEEDAVVCTARNRHPAGPGHLLVPLGLVDVNTRSRPHARRRPKAPIRCPR